MHPYRSGLPLLAAAALACAGAPAHQTADATTYYYGRVTVSSPDGRLPYGSTESAVKREVLDAGAFIRETVTRPGIAPGMRPSQSVLELKRRGKTLTFDAFDPSGAAGGQVVFADPGLKAWTFQLSLKAGGGTAGSGQLSRAGMKTQKRLSGPGRPMSVTEDLKVVTEREYQARLKEMQPPAGAE